MASSGGARGKLMRQALRFLFKAEKRPGTRFRMSGNSVRHVWRGEVAERFTRGGQRRAIGTGYHHRPGGMDQPGRRITDITRRDPHTGVYEGRVEFFDEATGDWVRKNNQGLSTFFPNHWSADKVDEAIGEAYRTGSKRDGIWSGTHDGVLIEGWYDEATDNIGHGWPVIPLGNR